MRITFGKHPDHAGPGPLPAEGTRADISQGHGVVQGPTQTQFGGSDQVLNARSILNEPGAWPHNTVINIQPNLQQGSREYEILTAWEMQTQMQPGRIVRQLYARNQGYIGDGTGQPIGVAGFPYNNEWGVIPHLTVQRAPYQPSPHFKQIDETAPIAAVYAGNPRVG